MDASPEPAGESDLLFDLQCQLREDFPNVDDAAVARQVHESWERCAGVKPLSHRRDGRRQRVPPVTATSAYLNAA